MTTAESVLGAMGRHFQYVENLGDGLLRGERRHGNKAYAVAFVDLSDSVVERSLHLQQFQEHLLGADFFSPQGDLRWNSYLYFLAGPKSTSDGAFGNAKSQIEADRHFARKFVLSEEDLLWRLGDRPQTQTNDPAKTADAASTWEELLRAGALASLLQQQPRTTTLDLIASGDAFRAEGARAPQVARKELDVLATGLLRKLTVGSFRRVNKGQSFEFGDVNLIVGANGAGKTSMLEAIEALYCGHVRRDEQAVFSGIVAEVEDQQGGLGKIEATLDTGVLKARNTNWYGRTHPHANNIIQGFTRFNFLDTDAAFRMAAEQGSEQIKRDLSSLLVGPETAKLWTYLFKLEEETSARLRSLEGRLPSLRRQVELLTDEIKRYREAPSEANSLFKAFRAAVEDLHPKWQRASDGDSVPSHDDRVRLEALSKALALALSAIAETPVTLNRIELRIALVRESLATAKKLQIEHELALKHASAMSAQAAATEQTVRQIVRWSSLVEAGVPGFARRLQEADGKVTRHRTILSGQSVDTPFDVPSEYAHMPILEAVGLVRAKLAEAHAHEASAALALSQRMQLGQSLAMLRRDLHDASLTFIAQSGEDAKCPVCGTGHSPTDLLSKLESLVASDDPNAHDSLRHNILLSKERVEQTASVGELLASLEEFRRSSGADTASTPAALRTDLLAHREGLKLAAAEAQAARRAMDAVDLSGIDGASWEAVRQATIPVMPQGSDPDSLDAVRTTLAATKDREQSDATSKTDALKIVNALLAAFRQLATDQLALPIPSLVPAQIVAAIERELRKLELASSTLVDVAKAVALGPDAPIEEIQRKVEAAVLTFDKAVHAFNSDGLAKRELKGKDEELQTATQALTRDSTARENLARAKSTLSSLVTEHSLDRATADAFNAIKGRVSDVFAQIHSPPEYALGDLNEGQLIIRRDDNRPHDANQVSTGQRAALALSIFLALNDSAKTAPPVILIDDPVAHIDDLNTLSFLDYLRDVAVSSRKQIFFATADARLAALFQRKFEFLGDKRFRRIALSPQHVQPA